ncbi:hypothetical protein IZY60_09175 [Lutibacter sp. B2]|nr:hypothetical protein [Lutibacter sp. B2]
MQDRVKNILKKEKVLCFMAMLVMLIVCLGEIELYGQGLMAYWGAFFYVNYLFKDHHQWKLGLLVGVTIVKLVLDIYCTGIDTSVLLVLYFCILGVYYILKDETKYKHLQIVSLILVGVLGISGSFYIIQNKLIKDRGLEKRIKIELGKKGYFEKLTASDLEKVRTILIHKSDNVRNIEGISQLKNLDMIFGMDGKFENIDELAKLSKLKYISIHDIKTEDLSFIKELKNLEWLCLGCYGIDNTFVIEDLPKLEMIQMTEMDLEDLSFFNNLKGVKELYFSDGNIKSLKGIENLTSLENIKFNDMKVDDISDIRKLKQLEIIEIEKSEIHNVESLKKLPNLKALYIDNKSIDGLFNMY